MFREEQTLRGIDFEEYNMFRDEQTLRGITCLENKQTLTLRV